MDNQLSEGGLVLAHQIAQSITLLLLSVALLLLSAKSCGSTNGVPTADSKEPPQHTSLPNGEVAAYKVSLDIKDGKCILKYDGPLKGEIETELPSPCEFSRGQTGNIEYHEYRNSNLADATYSVILLIGGPAYATHSDKFMPGGCGTHILPVSLSKRGVAAGAIGRVLFACPSEKLDEKMFGFGAKPV
jgi:hypothetical protein